MIGSGARTEVTIPILPCRSIDETLDFCRALGFEATYKQKRPNTYAVVGRGGIQLQFFVLRALDPSSSYGTCYVLTKTCSPATPVRSAASATGRRSGAGTA